MEFLVPRPRLGRLLFHLWLLGFFLGRVLFLDGLHQGFFPGIGHRPVAFVRDSVRLSKGDAPLKKELQFHLHGVRPGFHHDELALGHGFQLVRRHERALYHLKGLAAFLPLAYVTSLCSPAAQGLAHHLRRLAVGGEAAEDGVLGVVDDNFSALFAVILFQLPNALDDGDNGEPPGAAGREHHLRRLDLWQRPILITVEHGPVGQFPAVLVRHGEDLPVQLLDDEAHHEEFIGIFLRHHQEQGGLLLAESLRVYSGVEAEQLLHLRIEKGVEPGQGGGHDRGHGLVGGGGGGPGEPFRLVGFRQQRQQRLELGLAFGLAGGHQLLDDFKHGHNVPPAPVEGRTPPPAGWWR